MTHSVCSLRWAFAVSTALLVWCGPAFSQERFENSDAAVSALVDAAKAGDKSSLVKILGPKGGDIISSGDQVADRNARDKFIAAYDQKHSLEKEGDGKTILVMGEDDWPFPIPVVKKDGQWAFDAAAGLEEILLRRIGRNELATIQSALAYVAAQNDYAALDIDGHKPAPYAQLIVSSPGKKDGLFWPTTGGEVPSPLGELFAEAAAEGYKLGPTPVPYHGYYYRILKRQGAHAEGGAYDYVVNGRMIGGFGLVAYPAIYGNSGIMTFIVNQDGVVFQKDLGPDTEELVNEIDAFDPDKSWTKSEVR
jgi:hypothetical protein